MQTQLAVSNVNWEQWVTSSSSSLSLVFTILITICSIWLMAMLGMACLRLWNYKKKNSQQRTEALKQSNTSVK